MSKARCSYHHGDLRNALIVAAAELIERDGTLDFTMAEAATRAGVSAAAPYRHFALFTKDPTEPKGRHEDPSAPLQKIL